VNFVPQWSVGLVVTMVRYYSLLAIIVRIDFGESQTSLTSTKFIEKNIYA
jgi:hypothetical protein